MADDHPIVVSGLVMNIQRDEAFLVVAQAHDGAQALAMIEQLRPDVAIIDVEMPRKDGLTIARTVKQNNWETRIIFLTLHKERDLFHAAMEAGGGAFLVKDSALAEIAVAIKTVMAGRRYVSSGIVDQFMLPQEPVPSDAGLLRDLTPAERRILKLIAEGKSSKEIGADLSIHYRTVENHRTNISRKLGIMGSNALPRFALQYKDKLTT
ncbi:response regulator [Acidisarcina polymorpha]|nr:response regulator transcription factor [Acidisarcina polymorpha]